LTNNPSFGLYVTAVDGREADSTSEYWALWHNGEYAACGIGCLPVEAGDVVSLILTTFDQAESERTNVRVIALVETEEEPGEGTPGDGSGGAVQSFDLPTAYDFLKEGQDTDGSWNSELVTDWSAFALAASGAPAGMKSRLVSYLKEEEPDFESVRDYERHAMALMALGINPYTGGPSDYITPIVESFDGKQIDEPGIMNDDVFALIPLLHAGYGKEDEIIQETTAFIVDEQNGDGSWEGSVDMTAATIQALSQVRSLPGVQAALADAESYLREEQEADGGFGDPFATSWVLQAIEALGDSPADWKVGENTPLTYLAKVQAEDGGMKTTPDDYDTRAWATAYAIPAAKGLTWDDILRDFKKPVGTTTESEDASDGENATTTEDVLSVAFDEPLIAPYFATSTLAIAPEARVTAVTTPEPPVNDSVTEEVTDADGIIETPPNELVAGAGESGAWEWFKRMLGGFWSFVMELFS
ncbi:MAG: hypothetical protein QOE22_299, partial [Candidatus Parcubacteria bacterium]|nr:hypothetical protein [Candidatus Parcubacteria bacterium]